MRRRDGRRRDVRLGIGARAWLAPGQAATVGAEPQHRIAPRPQDMITDEFCARN